MLAMFNLLHSQWSRECSELQVVQFHMPQPTVKAVTL